MRVLVVGMSDSIHTARWLSQLQGLGWDLHLFPSMDRGVAHPMLEGVTVHHSIYQARPGSSRRASTRGLPVPSASAAFRARKLLARVAPQHRVHQLARVIRRLRPDVVHSLQTRTAGTLMAAARPSTDRRAPWIHSTWGSDLYLRGRLPEHQGPIREVLTTCDFLVTECARDADLARELGFVGTLLASDVPAGGGFDLGQCARLRAPGPSSSRPAVVLKGRVGLLGRALVGLRALERCADLLGGHQIVITESTPPVDVAATLMAQRTGLSVHCVPDDRPYEAVLGDYGRARLALALSISDGLPYAFLEAAVMGALPIQSCTSCAAEWIEDGKNGLLVPPDDPDVVEQALRRALTDDELVDEAARSNEAVAAARLGWSTLRERAIGLYRAATG